MIFKLGLNTWFLATSGGPIIEPMPKFYLRSGKERGAWFALAESPHIENGVVHLVLTVIVCCEEGSYGLASFGGN